MKSFHQLAFERVCLINLKRDHERLDDFYQRLPDDWPFEAPTRFEAIDGTNLVRPQWWQVGLGAWGCFQSHLRLIENALNDKVESILVLEDDAVCCDDFCGSLEPFAKNVPDDWEWIYLGGQHLHHHRAFPVKVCDHVYRPHYVHRAHAYALRGRRAMEAIYTHLLERERWGEKHHLDHRLGELHAVYPGGIYVPGSWVIQQAQSFSNIKMKHMPTTAFPGASEMLNPKLDKRLVAVVGHDSAARNAVAGMLHHLGISMGDGRIGQRPWECETALAAPVLDQLCEQLFTADWWIETSSSEHRINALRFWAARRCRTSTVEAEMIGGTHPLFSILAAELSQAWVSPIIVRVEGLSEIKTDQSGGAALRRHTMAINGLQHFESTKFSKIIDLDFRTEQDTASRVAELIDQLGIKVNAQQQQASIRLLEEYLRAY
ncbi:glycosyltransferase family 25 protein [Stieleria sp. JC731]|uniref:glycosyltransferase family 25 protein n=1 Tax=Pirellulaceae TaxID=2691357 RepID=UPI001E5314EF|nr:glycosyltransferase family 25 protein [Stieleria sp. JC731]MCC9600420.1 glycosyltransferase family 25 protein [Stieleria sp. JC731]